MSEITGLRAVWRYELTNSNNTLRVPSGAIIRAVGPQLGKPCVWLEVDPHLELLEERSFHVLPTGLEFKPDEDVHYVGTINMGEPTHLIWHVYEYTGPRTNVTGEGTA